MEETKSENTRAVCNKVYSHWPAIPCLGIHAAETEICVHTQTCTDCHSSFSHDVPKLETMGQSTGGGGAGEHSGVLCGGSRTTKCAHCGVPFMGHLGKDRAAGDRRQVSVRWGREVQRGC